MVSVAESFKIEYDAELKLAFIVVLEKPVIVAELLLSPINQVTLPISFHLALLTLTTCGRFHLPLYT